MITKQDIKELLKSIEDRITGYLLWVETSNIVVHVAIVEYDKRYIKMGMENRLFDYTVSNPEYHIYLNSNFKWETIQERKLDCTLEVQELQAINQVFRMFIQRSINPRKYSTNESR